jgi:CBS domain-containing protein
MDNKYTKLLRANQAELFSEGFNIKKLYGKDAIIKPVFLYPEDSAEIILKKLRKESVNVCVIVTKEKKFLGKISDNDIIKLFLQQTKYEPLVKIMDRGYRREFLYKKAEDMINSHKRFVRQDTPINKIIEIMWKEDFEYLPVLDKDKKVIGVITPSSIINLLKDY